MTDRKTPVDQALDLLLYAPLGLVLTAAEEVPKLVEKGRASAGMYRMVGQFAVNEGQRRAGLILRQTQDRLRERAGAAPEAAPAPPAASTSAAPPAGSSAGNGSAPSATGNGPATRTSTGAGEAPARPLSDDALAIPAYDTLSAPQVVQRLAGLSAAELESVRAYEAATRGRKTILSRVDQLQSGA